MMFHEWWATTGLKLGSDGIMAEPGPRVGHQAECQEAWDAATLAATERSAKIAVEHPLILFGHVLTPEMIRNAVAASIRQDPSRGPTDAK